MRKSLASLLLAFSFLSTPYANAWSLKDAHNQANTTLVQVGDWCSGTIIDKDRGLIATAAHCTEPAQVTETRKVERPNGSSFTFNTTFFKPIDITVWNYDDQGNELGSQHYIANVWGSRMPQDVAVLKSITPAPFTNQVKISTMPMSYGDKVYTVGNPLMIPGAVAEGHVLKPQYTINLGEGPVVAIVFDAFMAPGSSGGGLFNDAGELVGLTDWAGRGGPYLSTPVQNLLDLLNSLDPAS